MTEYHGLRVGDLCGVFVHDGDDPPAPTYLPISPRPGRRYAGAHEWGYGGSGPHQLAWDLLIHAQGDPDTAAQLYRAFAADVVSVLPRESWMLTQLEIRDWINDRTSTLIV